MTLPKREEAIQVEDRWYVLATSARADDRTRVLKDGDAFGVYDRYGDIHIYGVGEQGLYFDGTRFLSRFEFAINGQWPLLLNSTVRTDNSLLLADLTTPDLRNPDGQVMIRKDTLHVFRARLLWHGVQYEHLRFTNYGDSDIAVPIDFEVEADYADIFEVRGVKRARRGRMLPARHSAQELVLGYHGLDGVQRRTAIRFSDAPDSIDDGHIRFNLRLEPNVARDIYLTVACEVGEEHTQPASYTEAYARCVAAARTDSAQLSSSNDQFNDWLNRSASDLQMLVTDTPHGPYPYAGVPWFSTAFGRDGIITALQYLWINPTIARGVLTFLAANQAYEDNPEQDAEPGKILHEMRGGEMAALGEVPFKRYYGTVDATPLFVMLAGAYYERTGDRAFIDGIWPNVERALTWIDRYGDLDGDGFVEYRRRSQLGLVHQGWKDSGDSVFHEDGAPAQGPIALCEVQAYVYAAKRAAARLAHRFGDDARAAELERQAETLKRRFNETFWCPPIGSYAIALDGDKRPCRVRSSNAGHALYGGIAHEEYARVVADTLLSEDSFNGWGVRTIATRQARYNPMSYHNGSVWPHDNAMIAAGLARYGYTDKALLIFNGLLDASTVLDLHRLPELFCGFPRTGGHTPTLYPVACSPQAWAAGSVFMLLQACLGMSFLPEKPQLGFRHPRLPDCVQWLEIRNLPLGDGAVSLRLARHAKDVGINVLDKKGDVEISVSV
ncbi:MAG TPA: amylo-alpha-1,6-glucosidase [Burkholderiales bacterium]|nr:amylo-alpha-1,6-glucosidase [Burkholderiales bacterium]